MDKEVHMQGDDKVSSDRVVLYESREHHCEHCLLVENDLYLFDHRHQGHHNKADCIVLYHLKSCYQQGALYVCAT